MSLLLLFNQTPAPPTLDAARLVLPLSGAVSLRFSWGAELGNLPVGTVATASRSAGVVSLAYPWGQEQKNATGGVVQESSRVVGIVGKVA